MLIEPLFLKTGRIKESSFIGIFYRAGTPTTRCPEGIERLTTAPAPITQLSPTSTFGKTIAPDPIKTDFPIFDAPNKVTPGDIYVNSPIETSCVMREFKFIRQPLPMVDDGSITTFCKIQQPLSIVTSYDEIEEIGSISVIGSAPKLQNF
jgi:hypothetical protein